MEKYIDRTKVQIVHKDNKDNNQSNSPDAGFEFTDEDFHPFDYYGKARGKIEKEDKKEHLELLILSTLEINSKVINEGNNGIILEIDVSKLNEEDLELLGINLGNKNGSVFKILKIESSNALQQEYKMQKNAFEVLKQYNDSNQSNVNIAKVPEIYFAMDINISSKPNILEFLGKHGIKSNNINLMLMDEVSGQDLACEIYEKIIEHALYGKEDESENSNVRLEIIKREYPEFKDKDHYKEWTRSASLRDLTKVVERILNINLNTIDPDTKHANFKEIKEYMKKNDILLEKDIFERIKNTINIFHENSLWHNDMHERNIMITRDNNGKIEDVYIVDFAAASNNELENTLEDQYIYIRWIENTTSQEEKRVHSNNVFEKDVNNYIKIFNEKSNIRVQENVRNLINHFDRLFGSFKIGHESKIVDFINEQFRQSKEKDVMVALINLINDSQDFEIDKIKKENLVLTINKGLEIGKFSKYWQYLKDSITS